MNRHNQEHVLSRRQQVSALYLAGKYQSEIADIVGVTQQQVSSDLAALRKAWLASSLRDFDAAKAEELEKIDRAEREYWLAWERSQQSRLTTLAEVTRGEKPSRKRSRRREMQVGDPRFLDGILSCIEKRSRLLGLMKEQIEVSGEVGVVRLPSKAPSEEVWRQEVLAQAGAEVN